MRLVSFPGNTSTNLSNKNSFINLNFIVLLINKQSVSVVTVFQLISSNQSPIESKPYINEKQVATIRSFLETTSSSFGSLKICYFDVAIE